MTINHVASEFKIDDFIGKLCDVIVNKFYTLTIIYLIFGTW